MGKDMERIQHDSRQDNKLGNGEGGNKETVEEKAEGKTEREEGTREAREGRSKGVGGERENTGRTGTKGREDEQTGRDGFHIQEDIVKPEEVILEAEAKKSKRKTAKKRKDRIKDDIKLALISIYGAAGIWIDECFFLKPDESERLSEAIYRYLEEHNLLDAISEKSATVNLLIVFASVNIPKILTYYNKIKKEGKLKQHGEQSRKTANSAREPDKRTRSRDADADNAKTFLDGFYNEYEG